VTCDILHCNNLTNKIENVIILNGCGSEFGSICIVRCETGYTPVGDHMFTCDSANDTVEWMSSIVGGAFQCNIGKQCFLLPTLTSIRKN